MKTETVKVIDFRDIINTFCNLTNWSSDHKGVWNADLSKPIVFHAQLQESTCQHEQDWLCFYYPDNYSDITINPESLIIHSETTDYIGKDVYTIELGAIIQWLVLKNELPNDVEFLVKGW